MQMGEFGGSKQEEQSCLSLTSDAAFQQGMHILYKETNDYALSVERGLSSSEAYHKYDLESGIMFPEPGDSSFLASTKRFYGNVGGRLSFCQRFDGFIDDYACKTGVPYGVSCGCQQKEVEEDFLKSAVSDMQKGGFRDSDLTVAGNDLSGSNEKVGYEISCKPGWTKPPRPPRASSDSSRERHIKGISDRALLRRARLERMKHLKRQRVGKPSSTRSTVWALLFTVFFFVIVIAQGLYSPRTVSSQDSSKKLAVSNNSKLGQTIVLGNLSSPFSPLQIRENTMIETIGQNETNSSKW